MKIYSSTLKIKGTDTIKDSQLPYFRGSDFHLDVEVENTVEKEIRDRFGKYSSYRILPYKVQRYYDRELKDITIKTVVLENDILIATFLPEYGGRLYSLYNKKEDREILYKNAVLQPANLAIRDAWFSGGIEWNLGQYGHSVFTMDKVYFGKVTDNNGNQVLRLYAFERMKKLFYQIDFMLEDGKDYLVCYTKIMNVYDEPTTLYYWVNTAVKAKNGPRVFASASEIILTKPFLNNCGEMENRFAKEKYPLIENGKFDVSYPDNFERSSEYFFYDDGNEIPFEAVHYNDGELFFEVSTRPLNYRKMFCWGTHTGGMKWQRFLSCCDDGGYIEVQAGLSNTQLHTDTMKPLSSVEFAQVFASGYFLGLSDNYVEAKDKIMSHVYSKFHKEKLAELSSRMKSFSKIPVNEVIYEGDEFGATELYRLNKEGVKKPVEQLPFTNGEDNYLRAIIDERYEDINNLEEITEINFVVDEHYSTYIDKALMNDSANRQMHIIHKLVMLIENIRYTEVEGLIANYKQEINFSLTKKIIGDYYVLIKDYEKAYSYYKAAYDSRRNVRLIHYDNDLACDFITVLSYLKSYKEAMEVFSDQPVKTEMLYFVILESAYETKTDDVLEAAFDLKLVNLREGDLRLVEYYYKYMARKLGVADTKAFRKNIKVPKNIDFRMF